MRWVSWSDGTAIRRSGSASGETSAATEVRSTPSEVPTAGLSSSRATVHAGSSGSSGE